MVFMSLLLQGQGFSTSCSLWQRFMTYSSASRPDLIDSALLRPGRLDKSLLCNIPTREERKEVGQSTTLCTHSDSSCPLNFYPFLS
jgi:ATP-dependent 26S proteasome regulatory subunit